MDPRRSSTPRCKWLAWARMRALLLVLVGAPWLPALANVTDVELTWAKDRRYNPSLIEHEGYFISALKATSFKKVKRKTYWINKLYMCTGPDIQSLRCSGFNPWREDYLECEFDRRVRNGKLDTSGLGDVKVWRWPGKGVYAIFGRKPERTVDGVYCSGKVVYHQHIAQVRADGSAGGDWYLQSPLQLHVSNFTYPEDAPYIMEKNWMPFVHTDPDGSELLLATYSVHPHRVVHIQRSGEAQMRWVTADEGLFGKFAGFDVHGGPPVVHVPANMSTGGRAYYLGVMHHIERFDRGKIRLYRHFAYKFRPEPPFSVYAISDELSLSFYKDPSRARTAFVAYVAGLHLSADGTVYMTYGAGDLKARALILPLAELERNFTGHIEFLPHKVPYERFEGRRRQ